ncbi:6-phosphofructo-2-kinase/fructose-2,6-bisphosphatase-like [Sitophilus oryzae]|uniref:6-phosphofructo-2-kinase/fructose-2, 6-bisphosphatase-like n=1 Tax=Sitophilus oryzae TaxID=7048 RepID=A0A6J2XGJ4_SITOR|nr:6-phosphofructo-2-kinase/fructose-2,6-bisphosphatase-like [Sitophilus oryzae]
MNYNCCCHTESSDRICVSSSLKCSFSDIVSKQPIKMESKRFTEKDGDIDTKGAQSATAPRRGFPNQFNPLLVAMVGLPGRGKSLLAKRLTRYLNYTGDTCAVYDISEYRRKHMKKYASHEMFRADNLPAWRIRQQSFREALEEACDWLDESGHHVAILDGPNVSRSQRQEIYDLAHGQRGFRVMFIECVCEDPVLLERNFKEILQYGADYHDMATEQALKDLTFKMAHYKAQYESPTLGSLWELPCPMVKLLDGGDGGVIAHGVTGIKESKILAYVSTPKPYQQTLYFSRHGESEFNVIGRIGGDAPLSPRGRMYSKSLAKHIHALNLPGLQVWTSTLQRTKATSAHINAPKQALHELDEIWSGDCESLSYEELQERFPKELALRDREKLKYRYPQGESYVDVMQRLVPVLTQLECETNVLTVSHQAVLRCVLAYFMETPVDEIPYVHVPLHTIIKITLQGFNYNMETIKMPIECVNTTRAKPINCSEDRTTEEALLTLPAHFDSVTSLNNSLTPCT